jgi:tetratricopeptide (TPR) repeat protein
MKEPTLHPTHQVPPPFSHSIEDQDPVEFPDGRLNVELLLSNAKVLLDGGELRLARGILYRLLSQGDQLNLVHQLLAQTFAAEKRFEEASNHLEQSIAFGPSLETYLELVTALEEQKKLKEAAKALERTLHLRGLDAPIQGEILQRTARHYFTLGDLTSARAHLERALKILPGSDQIRVNLGHVFLAENDTLSARRYFLEAIALNSKNAEAWAGVGNCAQEAKDLRSAFDAYTKSLEIHIANPTALFQLVKIAYELKSYATAARLVEKYVDSSTLNLHLLFCLAGLQFHLGRVSDVALTCRRILEVNPNHGGAKDLLSRVNGIEKECP